MCSIVNRADGAMFSIGRLRAYLSSARNAAGWVLLLSIAVTLAAPSGARARIFWGDLHGHSELSDGKKSPYWYYSFCRDSSRLDFAALTDHDFIYGKDLRGYNWSQLAAAALAYNRDGFFAAIPGYEWTSAYYGHLVILYATDTGAVYSNIDPSFNNPQKLIDRLGAYAGDAVCVRAHPIYYAATKWSWDGDLMVGTEIVGFSPSGGPYGVFEYENCPYGPEANIYEKGSSVQDILKRGYRLALLGVGDSHNGRPGNAGLTAIIADTLTKKSVLAALRMRHCYATTGSKINIEFTVNGMMMGGDLYLGDAQSARIIASISAPTPILSVEVIKNNLVVTSKTGNGTVVTLDWVDPDSIGSGYYYLRVTLFNGHMGFTSPIWFKRSDHAPSAPIQLLPQDNRTVFNNMLTFHWQLSTDPDYGDLTTYYIECIDQDSPGNVRILGPYFNDWVDGADSLLSGRRYRWRIVTRSRHGDTTGVPSAWRSFSYRSQGAGDKHLELVYAYPNPFVSRLYLYLHVDKAIPDSIYQIRAYDITGRMVRVLYRGRLNDGIIELRWDGTNCDGQSCSPGVYLVGVLDPRGQVVSTIKVVRLK